MPALPDGLQEAALNVPDEDGLSLNVIVALGVIFGPLLVSATVAVQVVTVLTRTSVEVQAIVVELVR